MKEEKFILSDYDSYYRDVYRFKTNLIQRICKFLAEREIKPDKTSTRLATESLLVLNQWARRQQYSIWRDEIYQLKSQFLQIMNAMGYLRLVEPVQQIIKCNRCHKGVFTTYYFESGDIKSQDTCWHCDGTGVYKRVLLFTFHVKVGGKEFVWHQPADRVTWDVHLAIHYLVLKDGDEWKVDESLSVFKEPMLREWTQPTPWMFQRHLLRLAVYVTQNQMFGKLGLCDWKPALRNDARELRRKIGHRLFLFYYHNIKSVFQRVGLDRDELPF